MILEDITQEEAENFKNELEAKLQNKPLEENVKLSVAIGMAFGKGKNIENVVKQADENMYARKRQMKTKKKRK